MDIESQARKPKDLSKININEIAELFWWSYILRVPPERIIAAAHEVGNSSEKINQYLKATRH